MACTRPIELNIIDRTGKPLKVKCGHCINCLIEKQSQLEFLAKKELFEQYQKGHGASFVTLTYNEDEAWHAVTVPYGVPYKIRNFNGQPHGKFIEIHKTIKSQNLKALGYYNLHTMIYKNGKQLLENYKGKKLEEEAIKLELAPLTCRIKDGQNFLKRMRQNMRRMKYPAEKDFKVIYCTEYGSDSARPHMHFCFIGLSTAEVKTFTEKAWQKGLIDIGVLTQGGIRYVTKYITKSNPMPEQKKIFYKYNIEMPKICHSIGIGKKWICENLKKLYRNNFKFYVGKGGYIDAPKYVKKFCMKKLGLNKYAVSRRIYEETKNKLMPKWTNDFETYEEWQQQNALIKESIRIEQLRANGQAWNNERQGYLKPKTIKLHKIDNSKLKKIIYEASEEELTKNDINRIKLEYWFETRSLLDA